MSRLCTKCKELPQKEGTTSWCTKCSVEYERQRWRKMPKWKRLDKWLRSKYKITFQEFLEMYNNQDGLCATCSTPIQWKNNKNHSTSACVDHCHDSGLIRGLLCNHCNRALGLVSDNKKTLTNMLEYLNG